MIEKIKRLATLLTERRIYGFLSPYACLDNQDLQIIDSLIAEPKTEVVNSFEVRLCDFISGGVGRVITFGAGRMAFYSLLKEMGVGKGDEVCLTGFTCAVMANAVLRTGATPVYVDIDKDTLGMSPSDLRRKITACSKVVVPQHSFGIPCEIDTIVEIAHTHNLFVIEDCAISLGSIYKSKKIGTWGDAAIFSTDHTKPLNTLIGGFVYTEEKALAARLKEYRDSCESLTATHVESTVKQYIKEATIESTYHKKYIIGSYLDAIRHKLHLPVAKKPYLQHESASDCFSNNDYPYPAKLHPALAYVGSKSLQQYIESVPARKLWIQVLMEIVKSENLPMMYFNQDADIVPLRLVYILKEKTRRDFGFIDDWIWFKQPIVATAEPLENFGYREGSCPISEDTGENIMNLPIILEKEKQDQFLRQLRKVYSNKNKKQ